MSRLSVLVERDGETVGLLVAGEVDMASADHLEQAITNALEHRPVTVVVSLAGVTFLDSSGIGALLRGRRNAEIRGVHLVVSDPQPSVRTVLAVSGVLGFLAGPGQ